MNIRFFHRLCAVVVCALAAGSAFAQQTYFEMEQLTVNENVTTVITAPEPIRLVDIIFVILLQLPMQYRKVRPVIVS